MSVGSVNGNVSVVVRVDDASPTRAGTPIDASGSDLLPDPSAQVSLGGDAGAQLARLVLESAREDKKFGKEIRAQQEQAQQAAEDAQLEAMRDKAESAYAAGLCSGFSMAASGAVSAAGAGAVGRATAVDGGLKGATTKADAVRMSYDAGSKVIDAGGKLGAAGCQAAADEASIEAEHNTQIAGRHKRAAEDARDKVKDAKELVDRAIAFYKEYTTAKAEATRAALVKA